MNISVSYFTKSVSSMRPPSHDYLHNRYHLNAVQNVTFTHNPTSDAMCCIKDYQVNASSEPASLTWLS